MPNPSNPQPTSKAKMWTGYVLSALPSLMLLMSSTMKLSHNPKIVEGFTTLGFAEGLLTKLGIVELLCVVAYLVPATSVIGAVLVTGYLGGAIVTELRVGHAIVMPLLLGILAWGGLYFRDERIRALIPLRQRLT